MSRWWLGLAMTGAGAALAASPAEATFVSAGSGADVVEITGDARTAVDLVVREAAPRRAALTVEARAGTLQALDVPLGGSFCAGGVRLVLCHGATPLRAYGRFGDGDDRVASHLSHGPGRFDKDRWELGAGNDTFIGGPAEEHVHPGPGDDVVANAEHISYRDVRSPGVQVSLDGVADDGQHGTGNINPSGGYVTSLEGSQAGDVLIGDDGTDAITPGGTSGDDVIDGRGGRDQLYTSGGTLRGGPGADDIRIYAGNGPVDASAGEGNDSVRVVTPREFPAAVDAGPGDDVVEIDRFPGGLHRLAVTCGDGIDRVTGVDAHTDVAGDCETIESGGQ